MARCAFATCQSMEGIWTSRSNGFKNQLATQENMMSELIQQLTAYLTKITESRNNNNEYTPGATRTQYLDWVITPPQHITKVSKVMNERYYIWCTQCCSGKGLWVCTHNTKTHVDKFKCNCHCSLNHTPQISHQTPPGHPGLFPPPPIPNTVHTFNQITPQPHTQLSLADYLNNYSNTDTTNDTTPQP